MGKQMTDEQKLEQQCRELIQAGRTDLEYYKAKWEHELSTVSKLTHERDALRRQLAAEVEARRVAEEHHKQATTELQRSFVREEVRRQGAIDSLKEHIDICNSLKERAEKAEAKARELDGYNVGLASEVQKIRSALDDLVEAFDASCDMDEMDGPEYTKASQQLEDAITAARPFTEKAIVQAAITERGEG